MQGCVFQVEIVPGSGVRIDAYKWTQAVQSATATSMLRGLLVGIFPLELLMKSNLKGNHVLSLVNLGLGILANIIYDIISILRWKK